MNDFAAIARRLTANTEILEARFRVLQADVESNNAATQEKLGEIEGGLQEVAKSVSSLAKQQDAHALKVGDTIADMINASKGLASDVRDAMAVLVAQYDALESWRKSFEAKAAEIDALKARMDALEGKKAG